MVTGLRILIAPGPFKECLPAEEVANAIEDGLLSITPNISVQKLPMSDGGTGLVKRIVDHSGGVIKQCSVRGPLGDKVNAFFGEIIKNGRKIAVIESAVAAGLALVPLEKRDPRITSTYGVGELIDIALDQNCDEIIIGCGDSSTNDGGAGAAKALGIRFIDNRGKELSEGGASLLALRDIDFSGLDKRVSTTKITVACNLTSILCGPDSTSYIYGPQKGADEHSAELLALALENYAEVTRRVSGKDIRFIPGAGGSGGLASALYAFMNARLRFSFHVVTEFLNLERYLQNTDIVITGEGRVDARTATGKVACAVALTAKKYNIPVMAIAGSIAENVGIVYYNGIDHIEPICPGPASLEQSIVHAREWISEAAARLMRTIKVGAELNSINRKTHIND